MKYSLAILILSLFLFGNYLYSQANEDNQDIQKNENKLKRITEISKELRKLPHLIVDKPIYKPGDNISFKILEIDPFTRLLSTGQDYYTKTIFLKDSKGKTIYEHNIYENDGKYQLSKEIDGGQYSMEMKMGNHQKSFVAFANFSIEAFSNPKLLIDITLDSKAYSANQKVIVVSKVKRADGSTPETPEIEFSVMVDGQIIKNQLLRLDKADEGTRKFEFEIPADLSPSSSMIASVRVIDGGVVEQKTKSIPLVLSQEDFELKLYPEGGKLISNIENRVYFEALSKSGDPVDVEIEVHNNFELKSLTITKTKSKHEGRGYFTYIPDQFYTNNYTINVVKPFSKTYSIEAEGGDTHVSLDKTVVEPESPVSFTLGNLSPYTKKYKVSIFQKEKELSSRIITVTSGRVSTSDLPVPSNVVGVVRFRVSEIDQTKSGKKRVIPFFERLIFIKAVPNVLLTVDCKNEQGNDLFSINSLVNCTVTSRDESNQPISVFLTVDVVDEAVLSLVEKRKRRLQISEKVLLADEFSNVEDGGSYFDEENIKSDENLDLLMGVQGWRSFCYDNITEFAKKFGSKAERMLASSGYWLDDLNYFPKRHMRRGGEAMYFGGREKERAVPMMAQMDGAMQKEQDEFLENIVLSGTMDDEEMVVEEKTYSSVNPQKNKKTTNKIHHRTNFLETLYTAHGIYTDSTTGQASFVFNTSDSVTSYRVLLEALIPDSHSLNIDNGFNMASHFSTVFNCRNNFYVEPKVPSFVLDGDSIHLPIMYVYKDNQKVNVSTSVDTSKELVQQPDISIESFEMGGGSVDATRRFLPLKVGDVESRREVNVTLTVEANSENHSVGDMVTRSFVATPRGFKQNTFHSGVMQSNKKNSFSLFVPKNSFKISTKDSKIFPKPTSTLISSIEKLIQEPYGCFEQTSATLFPMIMALNYMKVKGIKNEELFNRANKILKSGYDKLASFEVKSTGGFEWFGRNPSSESLTAYGVFELEEMQKVYDNVDPNLISRAKAFLMGRKQDEGFLQGSETLDTFGRAPEKLTDAYIVWALLKTQINNDTVSSPISNLKKQVFSVSKWESDAYFLALVSDILFKVGQTEDALTIAKRLLNFQQNDGRVENAQTTITCSIGVSKTIETTSLSVLAWINFPNEFQSQIYSSINYLLSNCNNGKFGSTQGTILALKALIEYDLLFPSSEGSAKVSVVVNNKEPLTFSFDSSTYNHIAFPSFEHLLIDNAQNTFEMSIENENGKEMSFPFTLDINYRTEHPPSHKESPFELKVDYINSLGGAFVEGYSYQVEVKLKNKWEKPLGMCVLSVSVPGGFAIRHQKLKELVSSRQVAHYETRQNNIFFYFDFLKPSQEISFTFDLDAFTPGKYSSTPSYAYVYYGDEYKTFLEEVFVAQILFMNSFSS